MNFRQPNEDLFDSSRMSFGEHLDELRKVLVKALWGVIPCCIFGFVFANQIVRILEKPLVDAMGEYNLAKTQDELVEREGYVPPEYQARMEKEGILPREILVDPAKMVRLLQEVVPDFGTKVSIDLYAFRKQNFVPEKIDELCQKLSERDGSDDNQSKRLEAIWNQLPKSDQASISAFAKLDSEDIQLGKVIEIFDRLINSTKLSDAEAFTDILTETSWSFADLFTPPEPKPLAKLKESLNESPDASLNRQLNRALVVGSFPETMNPLKVDLVPFEIWEHSEFEPQALGTTEGFMVWLKASLFTGLIFAGPWVFYQLWTFVAAGLYPHEKKYVHIFLPVSIGLFVAGVLLAFFFVFQPVLGFLFSFNRAMGIAPEMRINDWLSFVMFLPLGFGIAFQLPLVMLFMNRIGLFSVNDYMSKWRIAVMIIFVLAMFLTPADPISMLLLAVPLTGLYFMGILLCRWMPAIQNPYREDAAIAASN